MAGIRINTGRKAARATGVVSTPLESDIQASVFEFLKTIRTHDLTLDEYSYAVPNGAMLAGDAKQRARYMNFLRKQGLKPGVSDVVIAYPRGPFHGAYIELKRDKASKPTGDQLAWRLKMQRVGYFSEIAVGLDQAIALIRQYWAVE